MDSDDEDFVPESLRGFLQAAEDKLNSDLDDVMNFEGSNDGIEPHVPKAVPDPKHAGFDEHDDDDDDDDEFFHRILAKEKDEELKTNLLSAPNIAL